MKKTFLTKRNSLLSLTDASWGAIALAFSLIVLLVRVIVPNVFWYVFTPVFHTADVAVLESRIFFSGFKNAATLAAENEKLVSENAALAIENKTLLQQVVEIGALAPVKGIVAGVVARPPESPYDTLVLAVGSHEGVTIGQEAFGNGGVPLGFVTAVQDGFSRVTLFSAPGINTAGWIGVSKMPSGSEIPLTISGAGAGVMQATAARTAGITVGDTVFVPGPGMLPIGIVVRIDSDPTAPGVTLRIQSTLNPFSVAWVTLRITLP